MTAYDEGLDLGGAFIGNKRFHIAEVAHNLEVERYAVAAQDVASEAAHMASAAIVSSILPSSISRPTRMQ